MIAAVLVAALIAQAGTSARVVAAQAPTASEQVASKERWPPAGVSRVGTGIISPELLKEAKPLYTAAAMEAKIQGAVEMEAVVHADGTVGEVRVVRSLDKQFGLDEAAVAAMKKWHFRPGKRDGVAVPVMVAVEMTFTVRK
ncbi:hypothetical protein BH18ACI5_BH18ACI5_26710 [soil metagenome]